MVMLSRVSPSRCTGNFDESLFDNADYVAEPKLDGARYQLFLDDDGQVYLYSRRNYPRLNKAANVPHFAKHYSGLEGTVLDGEVMLPNQKQLGDTTGLLNMLPKKAVAEQEKRGKLKYHVFDILFLRGEDVRSKPYKERRKMLELTCLQLNNPDFIWPVPQCEDKPYYFKAVIDDGGEGIVLKHLNSSYGVNWVKVKRRSDFSAIITGFQEGKGKYENNLGALVFSVYHYGKLIEIGKCSGMTDELRLDIWQNQSAFLGKVIDFFAQTVTIDKRMRHPVFHRVRNDLNPLTCTWEKIVDDEKKAGKTMGKGKML